MLIVSIMLTRQPKSEAGDETRTGVSTFGLLQLMWYLGQKGNHLAHELEQAVQDPMTDKLREWGKGEYHRFADSEWHPLSSDSTVAQEKPAVEDTQVDE